MNKILNQILWNRIISIVEEQAQTLLKTAFSTSVREAGDLSAGIYNKDGLMLGQAVTGTPGHVNAMAESVKHFIKTFGYENILIDDVYITNNPWQGTGHLHDITIVTPFFFNWRARPPGGPARYPVLSRSFAQCCAHPSRQRARCSSCL